MHETDIDSGQNEMGLKYQNITIHLKHESFLELILLWGCFCPFHLSSVDTKQPALLMELQEFGGATVLVAMDLGFYLAIPVDLLCSSAPVSALLLKPNLMAPWGRPIFNSTTKTWLRDRHTHSKIYHPLSSSYVIQKCISLQALNIYLTQLTSSIGSSICRTMLLHPQRSSGRQQNSSFWT